MAENLTFLSTKQFGNIGMFNLHSISPECFLFYNSITISMKHSFLFITCIAIAAFSGCKSNSTSTPPGPSIVVPNVGSNWMLQNTHRDSTGKVIKIDTSSRIVTATNMTYGGYSDVTMLVETNLRTNVADTVYIRYLSTGDISRYSSPALDPQLPRWFAVPYTTQLSQSVGFAGNISYLGYTHDTINFTAAFAGTENDTVAGVVYPALVVSSTTWQHALSGTKDSVNTITQTTSFIQTKGIFGNHVVSMNVINGKQVIHNQQTLIGVNLK
jgi:hypothetical protein